MRWELAAGMIVTGAILLGMEVYVPGFVLGAAGVLLQTVAVVWFFNNLDWQTALMLTVGAVLLDAVAIVAAIKVFPKTSTGKRMILQHTQQVYQAAVRDPLQSFVGKEGVTESMLRPTGSALIDGQRMDVVSEGEFLEKGKKIKVIAIREGRLVVKKID